jgi:hypothetical protein
VPVQLQEQEQVGRAELQVAQTPFEAQVQALLVLVQERPSLAPRQSRHHTLLLQWQASKMNCASIHRLRSSKLHQMMTTNY